MPATQKRKEMKAAYLEQGPPMGVYLIKNIRNNRCLIGASRNLTGSLNSHRFQLKYGSHRNADLQADWRRYGQEAFTFEVLDEINPSDNGDSDIADDLAALAMLWREKLKISDDNSY